MTEYMTERERQIMEAVAKAIPYMTDFDKGTFIGKAEGIADTRIAMKKEAEKVAESMAV